MAFQFKNPELQDPTKRNRYILTDPETLQQEGYKIITMDEGTLLTDAQGNIVDAGTPITVPNMNAFSAYVEDKKADKSYADEELAKKADKTYVDTEFATKSDTSYVDAELVKKVNKTGSGTTTAITASSKAVSYNELSCLDGVSGNIQTQLNGKTTLSVVFDKIYPVGCVYLSIVSTSPASLFGGSWTQITNDAYLKIVSSGAGNFGGALSHVHQSGNLGACLTSTATGIVYQEKIGAAWTSTLRTQGPAFDHFAYSTEAIVETTGSTGSASNNPYYYGIYMWKRTA